VNDLHSENHRSPKTSTDLEVIINSIWIEMQRRKWFALIWNFNRSSLKGCPLFSSSQSWFWFKRNAEKWSALDKALLTQSANYSKNHNLHWASSRNAAEILRDHIDISRYIKSTLVPENPFASILSNFDSHNSEMKRWRKFPELVSIIDSLTRIIRINPSMISASSAFWCQLICHWFKPIWQIDIPGLDVNSEFHQNNNK
jgi:hypothetical protein